MTDPHVAPLLHLIVLTPEDVVFEGEVLWAQVPLIDGLVGIWPGHAPLVGRMSAGSVEYATADALESLAVSGGVLRVDEEGRCVVLVSAPISGRERSASAAAPEEEKPDVDLGALLEEMLSEDDLRGLQGE